MADREFEFDVGPETSNPPTASDPSVDTDFVTLGYANLEYARRDSWLEYKATVNDVKAVSASIRVHGQVLFVGALAKLFYFDSASSATGDDVTVITPTSGTGRWLQVPAPAQAGQFQAVVAATPISGFSTHTTLTAAQTAVSADQQILVMPGTYAETLTMSKRVKWVMGGYGVSLQNLVWATGANGSEMTGLFRVSGTVTINASTTGKLIGVSVPTRSAISKDSTSLVFVEGFREDG